MSLDLRHLVTFRAVAGAQSFTRAAAALGYAQSSVTAHIHALEAELGVSLFDRTGKQIALTEAGRRLLVYSRQLLQLADEAAAAVSQDGRPAGTITISAPETLCTYRLPVLLQAFRERYPQARIVFRPSRADALCRHVRDGEIDVAFVLEPPFASADLEVVELLREPIALIGRPDHRLAECAAVAPADLAHESLLLTEAGCAYRVLFERALAAAGAAPREVVEFSSVEAIKQCVAAGMGLAVLPRVAVERELASGQLAALCWAGPPIQVITQMAWHCRRWQSPALRAFLRLGSELLVAELEPGRGRAPTNADEA
jgi:DNA-binding transcriptional LysR family regulator